MSSSLVFFFYKFVLKNMQPVAVECCLSFMYLCYS